LGPDPHIVIAGAGTLGCFLGGLLAAAGRQVTLLARPKVITEIRAHGLTLTDFTGLALQVQADALSLSEDASCLKDADLVIVTARPKDTGAVAQQIEDHAPHQTPVLTLQDGPQETESLRMHLPQRDVRAGYVAFHVVRKGQGCFHRETNGELFVGAGAQALVGVLATPQLITSEVPNITDLQWGRLLINLGSALGALSGLRLQEHLLDGAWRRVMAAQWSEAARVLRAHGIKPALGTSTPVGLIPMGLRLPRPTFRRVAGGMLDMDPQARSTVAHDLMLGIPTQIDSLQGQIMRMGAQVKRPTPLSARVVELIKLSEVAADGLPNLPVSALRSTL